MSKTIELEFFRMILTEEVSRGLFSVNKTRTEIINEVFESDFDFNTSRGKKLLYKFKTKVDDYIIGMIFKKRNVSLLENPDDSEMQQRPNWEPYILIINNGSKKGEDSQLFILQRDPNHDHEGRLNFLNKTLSDKINKKMKDLKTDFYSEFSPITTMKKFESLYGKENIKELIVEYTMPNFLGAADKYRDRLNVVKSRTNATKVKEVIENENGNLILDPDYEDLKNAVESSRLGQSRIKVKDFNRTVIYDSVDNETVKSESVNIGEIDIQNQSDTEAKKTLIDILSQLGLNK